MISRMKDDAWHVPSRKDLDDNADDPRHLFKFYGVDRNSLSCLARGEVWMSDLKSFNDPFDTLLWHSSEDAHEKYLDFLVEQNAHQQKGMTAEQLREEGRRVHKRISELAEMVRRSGMYCLSSMPYDTLLWSHYGDKHRGFCVQYARTKSNGLAGAMKVVYDDKQVSLFDILAEVHGDEDAAINRVLKQKAKCWEYEQEWRFVADPGLDVGEHRYYPLDAEIECVIFGRETPVESRKTIQRALPQLGLDRFYTMAQHHLSVELGVARNELVPTDMATGKPIAQAKRRRAKK